MPIQKLPDVVDLTAHNFLATDAAATASMLVGQDAYLSALIGTDFASDLMSGPNRTVNIKIPAALIARDRDIDDKQTGITLDEIKENVTSITLGRMALSAVSLSHGDLDFKIRDFTAQVLAPQAESVADYVENSVAVAFSNIPVSNSGPATSATYAPAYSAADPYGFFVELRKLLRKRGLPQTGLNTVVGPGIYADLLRSGRLVDASQSGATDALREGNVGRIAGFTVVESTRVADNEILAFHRDAFTLAVRAPSVPAGAPYGAAHTSGGYPMSITRAFDIQRQAEIQVVSTYLGVAALPLYRVKRDYTAKTAVVEAVPNGGVFRNADVTAARAAA